MKPIFWVIAVVVLQAIVAALAKKAQANQEAARAAKSAGSAAGSTPAPAAPPPIARKKPVAKFPPPKRPPAPAAKPAPRAATPRATTAGDSDSAMQSRQHLADSVARLQAAEAKIRNASTTSKQPPAAKPTAPKLGSFNLAKALRTPSRVREAFIMGEILGRPKSDRP